MNSFEVFLLSLLTGAEKTVPLFLHSKTAIAAFNVSEELVNTAVANAINSQAQKAAAKPDSAAKP